MKKYLSCLLPILTVVFARFIPFNSIIGSTGIFFSWSTMLAPVISYYAGLHWIMLFFVSIKSMTLFKCMLHFVHRLPLLGASLAYQSRHWSVSVLIPISCIILFVVHDVGSQAWPYALYWFIPVALRTVPETLWGRALTASFVAHGIGSVIWLYCGNISAQTWMSLIPLVIVERLLMAIGIMVCDRIVVWGWILGKKMIQRQRIVGLS